jgi:NADP-dependent 3-hydroxy acid dehydrogenase YdfG
MNKDQVFSTISSLPNDFSSVDILVNNAGLALGNDPIQEGSCDDWDCMFDTNVKGLLYMTRACLPGMVARSSGHIINIGSISGTETAYPGAAVYCATKHAVHALSKAMRIDLHGSKVRITEIDPGVVATEFSAVRWRGDEERANDFYASVSGLIPEDIADSVIYAATRRVDVNIEQLIITHVGQASVNHMIRK